MTGSKWERPVPAPNCYEFCMRECWRKCFDVCRGVQWRSVLLHSEQREMDLRRRAEHERRHLNKEGKRTKLMRGDFSAADDVSCVKAVLAMPRSSEQRADRTWREVLNLKRFGVLKFGLRGYLQPGREPRRVPPRRSVSRRTAQRVRCLK